MTVSKTPSFTWSFDEGRLTVKHLDKAVSLGRYATRELAAKAAAFYIRKQSEAETGAITPAPTNRAARGLAAGTGRV